LQYSASIGSAELLQYQPALAAEARPPTADQSKALLAAGIDAAGVTSHGHAARLLAALADRKRAGSATPRQIRLLERYGFKHAGQIEFAAASRIITRLAANGWRLPPDLAHTTETNRPTRHQTEGDPK
jgi:hypothetical protein